MSEFKTHSPESAPEGGREILEQVEKRYGFRPNLIATMVESPAVAKAYTTLSGIFGETSLSPLERHVVLLSASRVNGCNYCVAAHTTAARGGDVDAAIVESIREDRPIPDEKLEALRQLTTRLYETRGWLEDSDLEAFRAAGYGEREVLEVILGTALKTLSNYTNHVARTELDEAFAEAAWNAPERPAA